MSSSAALQNWRTGTLLRALLVSCICCHTPAWHTRTGIVALITICICMFAWGWVLDTFMIHCIIPLFSFHAFPSGLSVLWCAWYTAGIHIPPEARTGPRSSHSNRARLLGGFVHPIATVMAPSATMPTRIPMPTNVLMVSVGEHPAANTVLMSPVTLLASLGQYVRQTPSGLIQLSAMARHAVSENHI